MLNSRVLMNESPRYGRQFWSLCQPICHIIGVFSEHRELCMYGTVTQTKTLGAGPMSSSVPRRLLSRSLIMRLVWGCLLINGTMANTNNTRGRSEPYLIWTRFQYQIIFERIIILGNGARCDLDEYRRASARTFRHILINCSLLLSLTGLRQRLPNPLPDPGLWL